MTRPAFLAPLALLAQLGGADPVLVREVSATPTWFAVTVGIAQIIIAIAILTVVIVATFAAFRLMRAMKDRDSSLGTIMHNLAQLSRRANRVARTVNRMGDLAMENARKVDLTVDDATARVTRLFDGAERQVHALDSMIDVARDEAQDALIGSVAAMRGLRAGARELRRRDGRAAQRRSSADEGGHDDDEPADDDSAGNVPFTGRRMADDDASDHADVDDLADDEIDEDYLDDEDLDDDEDEADLDDDDLEFDDDLDAEAELLDTAEREQFERALEQFDRDLLYSSYLSGEYETQRERARTTDDRAARLPRYPEDDSDDRAVDPDVERPRRRPRA
ncbi:MAG TPA: hypothetical protein VFG84_01035 [Gemmatimonadaceae bacterium]|nr:hypothetical protein [Gemmatimonadaceae bacterium]